jgi:hypothetical protein
VSSNSPDPVHRGEAERWGGWTWRDPSRGEHYRTCNYCGSIHPDDVAAEPEAQAHWADAKYGWPHKLYIDVPNREPEHLFLIGASNATQPPAPNGWVPIGDIPDGTDTSGWHDLSIYRWAMVGTRPKHHAKLYSVHLADPAIGQDTLDRVAQVSGRRFAFENGRVRWSAVENGA